MENGEKEMGSEETLRRMSYFALGDRVKYAHPEHLKSGETPYGRIWGIDAKPGKDVSEYKVIFDDGVEEWYDPDELRLVIP